MYSPRLEIDLDKIEHNTRTIVELCKKNGIKVAGVTKGVAGLPEVGAAMIKGGVSHLADARIMNMKRMGRAKLKAPTLLIRIPRMSRSKEVVKYFNMSLISEWKVIQAISEAALEKGKKHGIILMVDVGDLREGVMIDQVIPMVRKILSLKGVTLKGIGTNLGCYGGIIPSRENMQQLVDVANKIEETFDISLSIISGGGSNCIPLVVNGEMPEGINHLRIGEALLLGRESTRNILIPGTYQDAFTLIGEIIEIKEKPSIPTGEMGLDSFGQEPTFKDLGIRKRAIIALGKQDVRLSGLKAIDEKVKIFGGSSDHIILDITDSEKKYEIGQEIPFKLLYSSLLSAVTSPYVPHYIKEDERWIKA